MQSSRVVPALGSLMLMLVHGKPPSEVTRRDGCDSHIKHRAAREKGVPKQTSARLIVSLIVPAPRRRSCPVRQHGIKLSSHCRFCTAVMLVRDKQCLGGRFHSCGQNSGQEQLEYIFE